MILVVYCLISVNQEWCTWVYSAVPSGVEGAVIMGVKVLQRKKKLGADGVCLERQF